jgi:hypothetical protein
MTRFLHGALLGVVLTGPLTLMPSILRADDHGVVVYEDKHHHDKHEWNERENRAYRMYYERNHHEYREFNSLSDRDRDNYWNWRHRHSDHDLRIDVH